MSNEIKPTCVIVGPVATRSGYGDHARQIADAMIKWGKFDVKIVSTRWGVCPMTDLNNNNPLSVEIRSRLITPPITQQPDLFIQVSIPNEFQAAGKFNVGVTAGIESSVPKAEWIEGLNKMNLNVVPSKFSRDVFEKVIFTRNYSDGRSEPFKLQSPMEVAFEGVDTSIYKKTSEPSADIDVTLDAIPETFSFLFVGHWLQGELGADRKDIGRLVQVFSETFKNKKNKPALILKTSGATFSQMDKHDILGKIDAVRKNIVGDLPNIYLIHGDITPTELNRLYNHPKVKAHVSLTHGEGFGRPLLEASLSGKPVIATQWSGHLDFLPEELAVLIPGTLGHIPPSACNDWLVKEAVWFNANYSVAAQKMEEVFEDYLKFVPNAERLRKQNSEMFTLENGNKAFVDALEKYLPAFETKVEIILPKFKKIVPAVIDAVIENETEKV
jgi:glycosyltransferase involved in cell wall biosynthesis